MLFNSYAFIFGFLPVALIGFFRLARLNRAYAAAWLAFASLFFYGFWNPAYVGLLMLSIACNYVFGVWIAKAQGPRRRQLLIFSIAANLGLLGYYKYANFFLGIVDTATGSHLALGEIALPLGISFFTFTQIAFLIDTWQGKVKEYNFVHYLLFVTYFPHLIAGPVLHHKEMMPQFAHAETYRFQSSNLAVGLTIFCIGLFKKTVLADGVANPVGPIFDAHAHGVALSFAEAWTGALCYTLQLYFDFSGYSDMAIGLSRMFGISLPLNFNSPYKSVNIIDFWRRWHMTLSRFLRDYLYIPLGGNRKGRARRYVNLLVTMLLGGLWHGAGWTFVIWGGLHGLYLVINHFWHALRRMAGQDPEQPLPLWLRPFSVLLTFLAVTVAWVFFRAPDFATATGMLYAMAGGNGYSMEMSPKFVPHLVMTRNYIALLLLLVWFAPSTQQLMRNFRPALDARFAPGTEGRMTWKVNVRWMLWHAVVAWLGILSISKLSEFIYFRF